MRQLIDYQKGGESTKVEETLKFLLEQFQLTFAAQKRYSPQCLLFAFKIYCSSRSTYSFLRESCLSLPHISYLRQLSSCFSESSKTLTGEDSHFVYLKQKCSVLAERERLVALLLDEIYVKPKVTFKGGSLQGFAENTAADADSVEATTVQAFMLTSVSSKNKDIAALQPVKNLDASCLQGSLLKVVKLVEKAGYKIVALISDNNRVNRNAFAAMCGGELLPCIEHPCDSSRKLFFLFDSVHLLKCIRNNWINQIDQVFWFPDLVTGARCKAAFAHLKQLYDSERDAAVKIAPALTYTALYPNNMQRQNVKLALKVFDEKNLAALGEFGSKYNCDVAGTHQFISTIAQLWKLFNVKHPLKGQRLNDPFCEPLTSITDHKLQWLKSIYSWLSNWEGMNAKQRQGVLSRETMFALKHTVLAACNLSEYLLTNLSFCYVLLGKFQTDPLEFRFGQYRQMSGANYHVAVTQIMESEKNCE